MKYFWITVLGCMLFSLSSAWGADALPAQPTAKDKCPVCGMFVAKYPDFLASIKYRDGYWVFFDGVKDMLKYYMDIPKYHPARRPSDLEAIYVTDYYQLAPVNAYEATYVIGSDVYGPMGRELIPFAKEADAQEFLHDHKGKSLLKFKDLNLTVAQSLD